jgi:hypothetical protein
MRSEAFRASSPPTAQVAPTAPGLLDRHGLCATLKAVRHGRRISQLDLALRVEHMFAADEATRQLMREPGQATASPRMQQP